MTLTNIKHIDKFFDAVDRCTDRVELVCDDFRINLKSSLAKYVAVANIFSSGDVERLELITYNQHDRNTLIMYMMDEEYLEHLNEEK